MRRIDKVLTPEEQKHIETLMVDIWSNIASDIEVSLEQAGIKLTKGIMVESVLDCSRLEMNQYASRPIVEKFRNELTFTERRTFTRRALAGY